MTSSSNSTVLFSGYIASVANIPSLRAYDTSRLSFGATVLVNGNAYPGDYLGGAYYFDPNSNLEDDDSHVVTPITGGGRWILSGGHAEADAARLDFVQPGPGAISRTLGGKLAEVISVTDFGADPTGEKDSYAAIMAAINSQTYGPGVHLGVYYKSGASIYFPPGTYQVSKTIQLKKSVRLYGDGSGLPWESTATLIFPVGTTGIMVHSYNTIDNTTETTPTTSGAASAIEGLRLVAGTGVLGVLSDADTFGGHGIRLRGTALVRNCNIGGFAGDGIHIYASAGSGGATEGNANCWRVEGGRVERCGGNGFFTEGSDANSGYCFGLQCSANTGWGVYDSSFLGNTYMAILTEANSGGSFKTDDPNAANLFLGCYVEGGQPNPSIISPSLVIGGFLGAGLAQGTEGSAPAIGAGLGNIRVSTGVASLLNDSDGNAFQVMLGGDPTNGDILNITHPTAAPATWRLRKNGMDVEWNYANGPTTFSLTGPNTAQTFNRPSSPIPNAFNALNFVLGSGAYARKVDYGVMPTTGTFAAGEVVYNYAPSLTGTSGAQYVVFGWLRITNGSNNILNTDWVELRVPTGT